MGVFEKMGDFLKKKPSKSTAERMDKQKVDNDRKRMEDIRIRLEAASVFPKKPELDADDEAEIKRYFGQLSKCINGVSVVQFDVTRIDNYISNIVQVLERAMKEGGSKETILRCFQGVVYGILNGHAPISENAIEENVVRNRGEMTDRYLRISQQSFEIDMMKKEMNRKEEQKKIRERESEEAQDELQEMINEHPEAYYNIKDMTPTERDEVTGDTKRMAALMDRCVALEHNIVQLDYLIGQEHEKIVAVESVNNTLFAQLQSWESEIDEQAIADIILLGKQFERELMKEKEMIKDLNEVSDEFDKALTVLLAGNDEKERVIAVEKRYSDLQKKKEKQREGNQAGRIRLEEEYKQQEEVQKQAEQEVEKQKQKRKKVYYN